MSVEKTLRGVYRGESRAILLRVAGQNIAGWEIVFDILSRYGSPQLVRKTTGGGGITITNAAAGEATIQLDPADLDRTPGQYYYTVTWVQGSRVLGFGPFVIDPPRVAVLEESEP